MALRSLCAGQLYDMSGPVYDSTNSFAAKYGHVDAALFRMPGQTWRLQECATSGQAIEARRRRVYLRLSIGPDLPDKQPPVSAQAEQVVPEDQQLQYGTRVPLVAPMPSQRWAFTLLTI